MPGEALQRVVARGERYAEGLVDPQPGSAVVLEVQVIAGIVLLHSCVGQVASVVDVQQGLHHQPV